MDKLYKLRFSTSLVVARHHSFFESNGAIALFFPTEFYTFVADFCVLICAFISSFC